MRIKHRMVGPENPFHTKNAPPQQYLIPEKIIDKPCKIDHKGADSKKIPFSGKLGVHGFRIIEDYRKAGQVTSLDWLEEQYKNLNPHNSHKKSAKSITAKLTLDNFERQGMPINYEA